MPPPPPKPKAEQIQLNRHFDSVAEIEAVLSSQYPGSKIVRTWEVKQLAVIIELPNKKTC